MPKNWLWDVGLLKILARLDLIGSQCHISKCASFVKSLNTGAIQADDGSTEYNLFSDQRQSNLTHLPAFLLSHLVDSHVDDFVGVRNSTTHGITY